MKVDKRFYSLAQHYRLRHCKSTDIIRDVYDGEVYRRIAAPVTTTKGGYSFLVNYDGATKWKSSLVSAIPIFMVCNELPFNERMKIENVIFCGVWFGKNKPMSNILFSELFLLRCINYCCDLPAKAGLFMQQQHGGRGACGFCNHSGCTIEKRFCYPLLRRFQDIVFDHSLRTESRVKEVYNKYRTLLREGVTWSDLPVINGHTGISIFSEMLPYWEWTSFGSIDIMHLMEGVFSLLMKLWTESKVCDVSLFTLILHGTPFVYIHSWNSCSTTTDWEQE